MTLQGRVLQTGDAVAVVRVRRPGGPIVEIQVQVDTGFNGSVSLPPGRVASLDLPVDEEVLVTLADGTRAPLVLYGAEIEWMGYWRDVPVACLEGEPLVGMNLLYGCHLSIDVVPDGRVEISPLPRAG